MTLRLSMTSSGGMMNDPLVRLEHDVNVSNATKTEVFQFLSIVIKNLIEKSHDDEKYRQLRLNNPKIQRLTSMHPSVMEFLTQTIGFRSVVIANEPYLQYHPNNNNIMTMESLESWRSQILSTLERVRPAIISHSSSSSSLGGGSTTKEPTTATALLSEKQKARRLLEQKLLQEKEAEKMARKRTVSQIAADKHVRENDPNWKPSVAAAAAKAGENAISTFRDKYGES